MKECPGKLAVKGPESIDLCEQEGKAAAEEKRDGQQVEVEYIETGDGDAAHGDHTYDDPTPATSQAKAIERQTQGECEDYETRGCQRIVKPCEVEGQRGGDKCREVGHDAQRLEGIAR